MGYKIDLLTPQDMKTMFAKELRRAGHTRKFSIRDAGPSGWEVRDEQDNRLLKHVHYTDWHRVERALNMFTLQIDDLESNGWSPGPFEAAPIR